MADSVLTDRAQLAGVVGLALLRVFLLHDDDRVVHFEEVVLDVGLVGITSDVHCGRRLEHRLLCSLCMCLLLLGSEVKGGLLL